MEQNGRRRSRRPITLLALAAMLIVAGLLSAISAPGAPPHSNKADAYGGPTPTKPTNPQSKKACDDYYGGPKNQTSDVRECRAIAKRNIANKKCNKKSGAAKAKCKKAAKKAYAKDKAAVARQRKAEKACNDKASAKYNALDYEDPAYSEKSKAISDEQQACMKKAQSA
jgi:hypothetical protein